MDQATVKIVLNILDKKYPTIAMHEVHGHDPFQMLVAVILSQRSRDSVTVPVAKTLFETVKTPADFVTISQTDLEQKIHAIGFYHAKAAALKKMSALLVEKYQGKVPSTEEELLSLPQVGRKTANIILTTFFNTPQIAVDIHVHRITNRLGWIQTTTPEQSEKALTDLIPKKLHSIVNRVFVAHGQTICLPRIPKCSMCPIEKYCQKVGVTKFI
ncbi:MAG: endonuclease III [Candidatus Woesebacteria bacterium]